MQSKAKSGKRALRKGRYSQKNGVYFVTIVTDQRISWFDGFEYGCAMSRYLHSCDQRLAVKTLCWVVMPDHVHILLELGEVDLSSVVQRLKAGSAMKLNRIAGRKGRFWEPGFYDHGLRHERDARGIARYIVGNPLRAGIVTKVGNYPFWNAVWL